MPVVCYPKTAALPKYVEHSRPGCCGVDEQGTVGPGFPSRLSSAAAWVIYVRCVSDSQELVVIFGAIKQLAPKPERNVTH